MGTESGPAAAALTRLDGKDLSGFAFDQLMRLALMTGQGMPRLRTELRLGHPPGDVAAISLGPDGKPELVLSRFGLVGPAGTMPWYLTGQLMDDSRTGKHALHEFLDLLSTRLGHLLHTGWRRSQPALLHEAGDTAAHLPLLAVAGLATSGMATRIKAGDAGLDEDGLARHAALLGLATRPAEGLERLLSGHFGLPVTVEQLLGGWVDIAPGARLRIGMPAGLGGLPPLGQRRWEVQSRLGICVGPTDLATLRQLTAAGSGMPLAKARRLTRLYLGDGFNILVRFLLDEPALEGPKLGGGDRLGVTGWLGLPPGRQVRSDTLFHWPADPPIMTGAPA